MKYMKMAAIAVMALALFSRSKKDEPRKAESAIFRVCINDSELHALGAGYANGDKTECMADVVLTPDNGVTIKLENQDLADVGNLQKGYEKEVNLIVNTVVLTTNGTVGDGMKITSLQGKNPRTEIPLEAKATAVTTTTANGQTVYSVALKPISHVARAEVFGKIRPRGNETTHRNAFRSIIVEYTYVNNYLPTHTGVRHPCVANGENGLKDDSVAKVIMSGEIRAADLDEFVAGTKVAGHQFFPIRENEAAGIEFYDHVIPKIRIKYSDKAIVAKPEPKKMTEHYVTMVKLVDATAASNPAIASFEVSKIYKLNLEDFSDDSRAGNGGMPDPGNPDTPDPESSIKRLLNIKAKPFAWTAVNIKSDINNNGYKKQSHLTYTRTSTVQFHGVVLAPRQVGPRQ